jgi:hypothetical protein
VRSRNSVGAAISVKFLSNILIGLTLTLLLGGMILLVILGLLTKPPPLEAKKPATWTVDELRNGLPMNGDVEKINQAHEKFELERKFRRTLRLRERGK